MLDNLVAKFHDIKARREDGDGGFTLIELLVVVVIIGILIAIAIPLYLNYQKGSKDKSAQSDLRGAVSAVQQCYSENSNAYPASTATNTAGDKATWTCGTATETANLSDGTTLTYTVAAGVVTMTTKNDGGNNKTYTYKSDAGGKVE